MLQWGRRQWKGTSQNVALASNTGISKTVHSQPHQIAIVITSITRIQQVADDHYLARVFSAREMLAMGTICLSCLFIGFGTEHWSSLEVGYVLAGWSLLSGIVLVSQIAGKKKSQECSLGGE
jgi:hypothetical protein